MVDLPTQATDEPCPYAPHPIIITDVVTDEMTTAGIKVAQLAFNVTERNQSAT